MNYKKGSEVLPAHLLKEIQKYVDGSLIYIPKKSSRAGWGSISGARQAIDMRNQRISQLFKEGISIQELSEMFHLGEDTIKKVIYRKE